jgi:hypothetical protein
MSNTIMMSRMTTNQKTPKMLISIVIRNQNYLLSISMSVLEREQRMTKMFLITLSTCKSMNKLRNLKESNKTAIVTPIQLRSNQHLLLCSSKYLTKLSLRSSSKLTLSNLIAYNQSPKTF